MSAKTLGVLAVVGLVVAFSLSSTLVKRAESPGVLVAFWRMIAVSVLWNAVLLEHGPARDRAPTSARSGSPASSSASTWRCSSPGRRTTASPTPR